MKKRILFAALILAVPIGLSWVMILSPPWEKLYDGKPVSYWLRHPTRTGSADNISVTYYSKFDQNAVPGLTRALETRDGPLKRAFIKVWPKLPYWMRNRLTAPVEGSEVRAAAASFLAGFGDYSKPAIPALIRALREDDAVWVRTDAAETLGYIGEGDERVKTALLEAIRDKESAVSSSAGRALSRVGKEDKRLTEALIEDMKASEWEVRSSAAVALGMVGSNQTKAIGTLLLSLAGDKDSSVRSSAAHALGQLGKNNDTVTEALLLSLNDPDIGVRANVASALGKIGTRDRKVIDALVKALEDKESGVRYQVVQALGSIVEGSNDKKIRDALSEATKDKDEWVHNAAGEILKKIDPEAAARAGAK